MIPRAPVLPPPPPTLVTEIVHESVVEVVVAVTNHRPIHHHWRWRRVRPSKSMVIAMAVHRYHSTTHHRRRTPTTTTHHRRMAPLPGNRVRTSNMAADQLVAAPGSLDHLNRLAVAEAVMTCWAGVGWRNQSLVGLAVGTVEQIREEAAGLAHGDPGVPAGGRVVQCAAAHCRVAEVVMEKWVGESIRR
jgi:hypothetical protein